MLRAYSSIYFLYLLLFSAMEFTLGFLTHIRFQFDSRQQGGLYLFSGFWMLVIQGLFVRRVQSTVDAQSRGALIGICAIVPAFLVIAIAQSLSILYSGIFLYSVASATVVPFLTTMFTLHCDPMQRGSCLGAFRSIGALARACGPLVGSFLFWLLGPTASYTIGAFGLLAPCALLFRLHRKPVVPSADEEIEQTEEAGEGGNEQREEEQEEEGTTTKKQQ